MSIRLKNLSFRPVMAILLLAILTLGLQACGSESGPASSGMAELDKPAPDFTLKDLDGNTVRLSDLRGKVVFLNFWATWCPPCRAEMPDIEKVHRKYRDRDVVVLGIDLRESVSTVRAFIGEGGYTWTFLLDTTGKVGSMYQVRGIPASYFIDRKGVIRAVAIGAMTGQAMEAKLAVAMQ
ncbi:MAG TPA: TlpA disulfide reductase family protein [Dehalococcoidales bacterium]|nr:TlpA disulfide reductase family protein [Dehalococcoidales bacterium]